MGLVGGLAERQRPSERNYIEETRECLSGHSLVFLFHFTRRTPCLNLHTFACRLTTGSRLDAYDNPDGYVVSIEDLKELKPVLQAAFDFGLRVSPDYFRHVEIDWRRGDWVAFNEQTPATDKTFQDKDPLEAGWAADFSDIAPLDGFSIRTNGHYIEFRCYEADTGIYFWTDPIYLRGDLIVFCNLACNTLTGEVTEVDNESLVSCVFG